MFFSAVKTPRRDFLRAVAASSLLAATSPIREIVADDAVPADAKSAEDAPKFVAGVPVWAQGRETEMNVTLRFDADVTIDSEEARQNAILRVTGSSIMRATIDGQIACYGPARGPRGWFRVDEWDVAPFLKVGANHIQIDAAGYNSVSYYLLDQPAFLQAELIDVE